MGGGPSVPSQHSSMYQASPLLAASLFILVVAVATGRPATTDSKQLQELETALEDAALHAKESIRVTRGQPELDASALPAEETGQRGMAFDIPWSPLEGRDAAEGKEAKGKWFSSGYPVVQGNPHGFYNVPPAYPPRPLIGGGGYGYGCSGTQTLQIQDAHFPTQSLPQSYTATVPFIAGYRLTPILGQKQIQLNEGAAAAVGAGGAWTAGALGGAWASGGATGGWAGWPSSGGGCPFSSGGPDYWQTIYSHGRQAAPGAAAQPLISPDGKPILVEEAVWPTMKSGGSPLTPEEEILRPFEAARFFQPPLDLTEHGLRRSSDYQQHLTELQHQAEHVESLRDSVSDVENSVAPQMAKASG